MHRYLQNRNLIHPRNNDSIRFFSRSFKNNLGLWVPIDQELVFNIFKIKSITKLIKINISAHVSKSLIYLYLFFSISYNFFSTTTRISRTIQSETFLYLIFIFGPSSDRFHFSFPICICLLIYCPFFL